MTNLCCILVLFLSVMTHARGYDEVLAGGLTYHLYGGQKQSYYSNKVTNDGALISNPLVGYRQVFVDDEGFYKAETVFGGVNSLAEPMAGYAYSGGGTWSSGRVGLIAGFYFQDNSKYLEKGIIPPMIVPINGWSPVPVVGVEIVKNVTRCVTVNTLITPMLLNVSLGYRF